MRSPNKLCLIVSLTLSVLGCSGGPPAPKTVVIAGAVTLDGTPVEAGAIQFTPKDGKNPSSGAIITAGKYSATVPKGKMKISISSAKVVGLRKTYDAPESPMENVSEEMIPAKYNSESTLERDVQDANADVNFDLKTT